MHTGFVSNEKTRNRVVVFRLTEHEYVLLKKASSRARRSLSDFTRAELLASMADREVGEQPGTIRQLRAQISELHASIESLKQLLSTRIDAAPGVSTHEHSPRRRNQGPF